MKFKKRSRMEKNSTFFGNAYFDTKKKWENPSREKQKKIIPSERLHLSQIHQRILPAFQVPDRKNSVKEFQKEKIYIVKRISSKNGEKREDMVQDK